MKKFSTYNGLFTHNPTIFPQNSDKNSLVPSPCDDDNESNFNRYAQNFDTANENSDDISNKEEFLHYPQTPFNVFDNIPSGDSEKTAQTQNDESEKQELNEKQVPPNYSDYTLSYNAKMILECMKMHDKIINNFKNNK